MEKQMGKTKNMQNKILGGLWGAVVGDALGVPVEFKYRDEVRRDPVTGMRGYGTFNLPAGSWSDDSSLLLCTADSLARGFDPGDIALRFMRWMSEGLWTPYGNAFDIGHATRDAIGRLKRGVLPDHSGGAKEGDNGNGSLMRIIPVALFFRQSGVDEMILRVHQVSSITHRHPRSLMACGIYCLMVRHLLAGRSPRDAYGDAIGMAAGIYNAEPFHAETRHFSRVLEGRIEELSEDRVNSSGYVIDTLEASIWCLLTTGSYDEAVLKAVNLGHDTDTTGCVTGGLAGVYYGMSAIPEEWVGTVARREEIQGLFGNFMNSGSKS
jgi:ADP-ribosyl-[dinitrogen reductase] hydrolase